MIWFVCKLTGCVLVNESRLAWIQMWKCVINGTALKLEKKWDKVCCSDLQICWHVAWNVYLSLSPCRWTMFHGKRTMFHKNKELLYTAVEELTSVVSFANLGAQQEFLWGWERGVEEFSLWQKCSNRSNHISGFFSSTHFHPKNAYFYTRHNHSLKITMLSIFKQFLHGLTPTLNV